MYLILIALLLLPLLAVVVDLFVKPLEGRDERAEMPRIKVAE